MANHAHSTRAPLLPPVGAVSPLLPSGAGKQLGPVTKAVRTIRSNEAPTWEMRQREIEAEERAALRALRRRVAEAVTVGIAFLDETGGDPDLEDGGDLEPSLCGSNSATLGGKLTPSTPEGDEREHDDADLEGCESDNEWDEDVDREPSLGSLGGTADSYGGHGFGMVAEPWAGGTLTDREVQNEDGGDINDEPHDPEEDKGAEEDGDFARAVQFSGYNYHPAAAR